jgi:hypothetical protein
MKLLLLCLAASFVTIPAQADLIPFDLIGTAGPGLLPGNEPGTVIGGTGGEIGAGILFDDVLLRLFISNVGWGSSQGFNNLSSTATASHIHGPTATNNGNGFTQTAGVFFTLTRSSSAVTGGTFTDSFVQYSAAQATDLFNGKHYINIHTSTNGGGELRGFLVPAVIPEPTSGALLAIGSIALWIRRRRFSASC